MQDIIERLDAELAAAPATGLDIGRTVAAGRVAVRRRRVAAGVAGLATVLVVGGSAALLGGGGETAADRPPVAGTPTPSGSPTAGATLWNTDEPVQVLADGTIAVHPDATVVDRGEVVLASGLTVEAVHVRIGRDQTYAYVSPDGSVSFSSTVQGLPLRDWVRWVTSEEAGETPWVRFDEGSHLVANPGTEIVQQQPAPGLGDNFAAPGDPTAVAEVVRDGVTYFIAARMIDGAPTEGTPYRKDDTVTTLAAFITYARTQFVPDERGGSEGLR